MSFNTTTLSSFLAAPSWVEFDDYDSRQQQQPQQRPSLLLRMAKRLTIYLDNTWAYIQNQFNEHTAASIASCSVLIIVLSIICCFIITLMREEEKRIKEQYKKLNAGSSQSFIAIRSGSEGGSSCGDCYPSGPCSASARLQDCITSGRHLTSNVYQKSSFNQFHGSGSSGGGVGVSYQKIVDNKSALNGAPFTDPPTSSSSSSSSPSSHLLCNSNQREHHNSNHHHHHHHHQQQQQQQPILHKSDKQVRLHELRRETYFGLVRLAKPGCRTIVLLCDAQSRAKLLSKFYQCVYPYRKNKTLQFAFLLIERNIGWYKDLLKSALSEKRYFRINPINCIGTVLVLNGFKKYFSVYHASNARWNPPDDPPFLLLEESLLDNLPEWLERVFASKVNRYYVESWPDKVQYTY